MKEQEALLQELQLQIIKKHQDADELHKLLIHADKAFDGIKEAHKIAERLQEGDKDNDDYLNLVIILSEAIGNMQSVFLRSIVKPFLNDEAQK